MGWSEDVKARFSDQEDAAKWDQMYEDEATTVEEEFFRRRRDYTVDYVSRNFDKSAKICDLGCGAAPVTFEMLKRGYDIVGVDYSFDMLRNAKRRLEAGGVSRVPLVNSNGETLPFADGQFDCVVCLGVISYVEGYAKIIKEIRRILKPGGTAIISYRNKSCLFCNDPVTLPKHLVKKVLISLSLREPDKFRIGRYMLLKEVQETIERTGLKYLLFKGIGFGPHSIGGRKLLSVPKAIKFNDFITSIANKLGFESWYRTAADVHILIYTKIH
jgi:ubiquinone/menaquinone biosynthesis C-methylase UbiE